MPAWIANALEAALDFSNVLNASISASWLILALILLRLLLKKAPRWLHVALWGLVALRLLLPFSIESPLSLIPSAETLPSELLRYEGALLNAPAHLDLVRNPLLSAGSSVSIPLGETVDRLQIRMILVTPLWFAGIALLLLYSAVSCLLLKRKVYAAVRFRDNIYQSEHVSSPFVLGIFRPRIYLPCPMEEETRSYVLAHEEAHIRRRDHCWKPLGFLLLTVHWFNPFMWLAYVLLCRDIELACDECVIRNMDSARRADYAQALLHCSTGSHRLAACPLAFGEVSVKKRVTSALQYKKPALWLIAAALVVTAAAALCFLTDPVPPGDYIMLTQQSSQMGNRASYEISLGQRVGSGSLFIEQWLDGSCIRSSPVTMTRYVEDIQLRMEARQENGTIAGMDVRLETNQYGGSLLAYFPFPEGRSVLGWSFTSYGEKEAVKLTPGDEIILAAMAFDEGGGVRVFDCETLRREPERLQTADHMLVIRACFYADFLGLEQVAPASGLPEETDPPA